jgi:hypothetical protein
LVGHGGDHGQFLTLPGGCIADRCLTGRGITPPTDVGVAQCGLVALYALWVQ